MLRLFCFFLCFFFEKAPEEVYHPPTIYFILIIVAMVVDPRVAVVIGWLATTVAISVPLLFISKLSSFKEGIVKIDCLYLFEK